ncbi:unnamed protein product [Paramecium sonneborni]|uniref:Uncharacterized protein n=1 Tax=Paramecium sonneborni TaxID=65129 RepID=A0A8S1QI85_9CILI|nr:unnamed protein product [Paramecium sonneborni]
MQNLSIYTFSNIFKFLQVEEIYSKLTLSNFFINLLYNPQFQKVILSNYYPNEILQKIDPQHYFSCIKSLKGIKVKEIPFWGIQTNAGLAYNSLRFWIGKTFMKTNSPQVGLTKLENAFISGTLAQNQVDFKNALIDYCQNFIDLLGLEIASHYFNNGDQILENKWDIQKIKIFDIFRSFQILLIYNDAEDWECIQYLRNYAQQKHEQIYNMLDIDHFNLKDDDHTIIPEAISLVQEIEINRRTQFSYIIKTILIFTSEQQYIPNQVEEIYNCQTKEKLLQFIQNNPQFIPQQTNINILQNLHPSIVYETKDLQDYLYCTFKPTEQKQPLIWVQFVNPNADQINLKFNQQTQRLAKSIQLRILDVCFQQNAEFQGLSLAYISLKGMTFHQADWTNIQELPN